MKWLLRKYYTVRLKSLHEKLDCIEDFISHLNSLGPPFGDAVYMRNCTVIKISEFNKKLKKATINNKTI